MADGEDGRRQKWFDKGNEDAPKELWTISDELWEKDGRPRRDYAQDAVTLYHANMRHDFSDSYSMSLQNVEEPSYNVIAACTDTMVAHITRNRVRPLFLTEGGDAEMQEKALAMQEATEAVFDQSDLYGDEGTLFCRDGILMDAGAVKTTVDYTSKRVSVERIFAHEVLVPRRESRMGKPRQIGHQILIDRDVAMAFIGDETEEDREAQDAIEKAKRASEDLLDTDLISSAASSDMICIREWWHLPSAPVNLEDKKANPFDVEKCDHDGVRMMVIEGYEKPLIKQAWPYPYFPISFFLPRRNTYGMWSKGFAESLAGAQLTLRKFSKRIDGILHLHGVPRLLVWKQAKIQKAKIQNAWSDILETAVPPQQAMHHITPQSIPADLFQRQGQIVQQAEKQEGISELSISAQRPPGIDHAPGLQMLADTESIRHTMEFRAWQRAFIHMAGCIADGHRLLAEREPDYKIVFGSDEELRSYDWKKIDIGRDKTQIRVWPTDLLAKTPQAKLQQVMDGVEKGIFTLEEVPALLDYPDIKAVRGNPIFMRKNIEKKLDLLRKGDNVEGQAHPHLNLKLALQLALEKLNQMEYRGESEGSMKRVRQFIEDVKKFMTPPAPPPPPPGPPMPPGPGPGGPPTMPPQG